jgi:hypothetical protein
VAFRVDVVLDPFTREKISVPIPLDFTPPPERAREELGLGAFVDLKDPWMARAAALLRLAHRGSDPPIPLALLGGAGYRLLSPTANDEASGLRRPLHDLDLACRSKDLGRVRALLRTAGQSGGSGLTVFETRGDLTFNTLLGGRRLRFHLLTSLSAKEATVGTIDLLADEFRFCHTLDFREELEGASRVGYTLRPETMLLTKLQFIQRIPVADAARVPERVLEPFGKKEVLLGMEGKDARDVIAYLSDVPVLEGADGFSEDRFRDRLVGDFGLWKTSGLNLAMLRRSPLLDSLPPARRATVVRRLEALERVATEAAPHAPRMRWRKEWWEDVESPSLPASEVETGPAPGQPVVSK